MNKEMTDAKSLSMKQPLETKNKEKELAAGLGGEQGSTPLSSVDLNQKLINSIANLDEELALEITENLIDENAGRDMLNLALEGLKVVGRKYEAGEYYAAGLVMAGEIMRQILNMVSEKTTITVPVEKHGVIVLGTVEGDIHELGKDLVKEILVANGFDVRDLGVDVAPEVFLAETIKCQPDLVGISILISSSYPHLSKTVTQLRNLIPAGFKRPGIIIGGGAVDGMVFEHIKADLWCQDLVSMGDACRDWIAKQSWPSKAEPVII